MSLNETAPAASVHSAGDREAIEFALVPSTLGHVLIAASSAGVCAIFVGGSQDRLVADLRAAFPDAEFTRSGSDLDGRAAAVVTMIETPAQVQDLRLDLRGSDFEIAVWQALRKIPAGRTTSYSELARMIGPAAMAKDVGAACAANKIAVAVPCHRVLRKDGSISGYRWGVARKRALLKREGAL
jgi:AraC family transcriptional regulator of adaptative response/methylated-DNA-[protein]-cysteine methyltransferase